MDPVEQIKTLSEKLGGRFDKIVDQLAAMEKSAATHAEQLKRLGGDVVEGDASLALQVRDQRKAMEDVRKLVDQYARQLPTLMSNKDAARDPEYIGFWPNENRAKQFGLYVLAGLHRHPEVRRRCAQQIVNEGLTLRSALEETRGQFVKGDDFIKALGESSDTAGGYLVPDEFMTTLIRHVNEYGVARARLRKVPMSRDRQSWPKRTGGFTVYYPDEGAAPTASDLTFGKVTLTAKKWAVLTLFSRELEEDSAVALGELIAMEIGLALAIAEDTNAFMGDGTSAYCGIVGVMNSPNVAVEVMASTKDAFADVVHDDLVGLSYAVPAWVRKMPDCGFYMSPGVESIVAKLKGTDGHPLYASPTEGFPLRVAGYPVVNVEPLPGILDTAASKKFMAFGSLMAWGFFGQRRGISLERSAEYKWAEDQIAIKAVPRQDIVEADGTAMAVLKTAAS